jgi:Tfp pilus assembly pilus retraction ATPase PilT
VAAVLRGVLAQQLCARADGAGRIVAADLLIVDGEVRDRLAEMPAGWQAELRARMAVGRPPGSGTYDRSLIALARRKRVTRDEALARADDPAAVARALAQVALGVAAATGEAEGDGTATAPVEDDARAD